MSDCGCTHESPCGCEGCKEKDALVRVLYEKIAELEETLKESAQLNTRCNRH